MYISLFYKDSIYIPPLISKIIIETYAIPNTSFRFLKSTCQCRTIVSCYISHSHYVCKHEYVCVRVTWKKERSNYAIPLCNKRRTRPGVKTPCFMGKPCLSHPPIILKTYPLNSCQQENPNYDHTNQTGWLKAVVIRRCWLSVWFIKLKLKY